MKSDTERKKFYSEKLHKRKSRLHVHLSKDLRAKLKVKKRAVLVRKGDTVKVMRGPGKGKEAKVSDVNTLRLKVFVEGVVVKNVRGREVSIALEPSNLLLLALESTKERKQIFSEDAFKKAEAPKKEAPKAEAAKSEHAKTSEHAHQHGEHAHEGKEHGEQAAKGSGVHAQTKPNAQR
ncbi:MAG: 50S ribosomal protein L24 [Candidatus Micrarchaeota archaeon]